MLKGLILVGLGLWFLSRKSTADSADADDNRSDSPPAADPDDIESREHRDPDRTETVPSKRGKRAPEPDHRIDCIVDPGPPPVGYEWTCDGRTQKWRLRPKRKAETFSAFEPPPADTDDRKL